MIGLLLPLLPALPSISPLAVQAVFFVVLLLFASVIDIRSRVIPNSICALTALTGLITFSPVNLFGVLAALPLLTAALCKQDSIGGGDIKLTAACGLILGFGGGMTGLVIGLAIMIIFYAVSQTANRFCKEKNRKRGKPAALPMAPFLSIGFITIYFINNALQ